jgi:uncharacterized protein YpiB (UPF0302 family)
VVEEQRKLLFSYLGRCHLDLAVYALAIDKYIEVVWETAVRKYRISELRTLIDQALDERDEESFYRYSTELKRLRKGE